MVVVRRRSRPVGYVANGMASSCARRFSCGRGFTLCFAAVQYFQMWRTIKGSPFYFVVSDHSVYVRVDCHFL